MNTNLSTSEQATRKPKQARSRQTRDSILQATLVILEENGIEKISTNQIAKTAEINIATLYKYFDGKYQILNELALAFGDKQADLICSYLQNTALDTPLEAVCSGIVDAIVEGTRSDRALVQLQRALTVIPELHLSYQRTNIPIGEAMKPFLLRWGIKLNDRDLETTMICLGEAFGALQDLALSRSRDYDSKVIAELKLLVIGYYQAKISQLA